MDPHHAKIALKSLQEYSADDINRQQNADAGFLGILKIKCLLFDYLMRYLKYIMYIATDQIFILLFIQIKKTLFSLPVQKYI